MNSRSSRTADTWPYVIRPNIDMVSCIFGHDLPSPIHTFLAASSTPSGHAIANSATCGESCCSNNERASIEPPADARTRELQPLLSFTTGEAWDARKRDKLDYRRTQYIPQVTFIQTYVPLPPAKDVVQRWDVRLGMRA